MLYRARLSYGKLSVCDGVYHGHICHFFENNYAKISLVSLLQAGEEFSRDQPQFPGGIEWGIARVIALFLCDSTAFLFRRFGKNMQTVLTVTVKFVHKCSTIIVYKRALTIDA